MKDCRSGCQEPQGKNFWANPGYNSLQSELEGLGLETCTLQLPLAVLSPRYCFILFYFILRRLYRVLGRYHLFNNLCNYFKEIQCLFEWEFDWSPWQDSFFNSFCFPSSSTNENLPICNQRELSFSFFACKGMLLHKKNFCKETVSFFSRFNLVDNHEHGQTSCWWFACDVTAAILVYRTMQ